MDHSVEATKDDGCVVFVKSVSSSVQLQGYNGWKLLAERSLGANHHLDLVLVVGVAYAADLIHLRAVFFNLHEHQRQNISLMQ